MVVLMLIVSRQPRECIVAGGENRKKLYLSRYSFAGKHVYAEQAVLHGLHGLHGSDEKALCNICKHVCVCIGPA